MFSFASRLAGVHHFHDDEREKRAREVPEEVPHLPAVPALQVQPSFGRVAARVAKDRREYQDSSDGVDAKQTDPYL